jgi:uncharacterized protein (DUF2236 family)
LDCALLTDTGSVEPMSAASSTPLVGGPIGPLVSTLRRSLQSSLAHLIVGDDPPSRERSSGQALGWFGPDSMTWMVHGDSSVLVGGVRALMLQTMHPLAMAGVAEHSNYKDDPLHRLWRTSAYVGAVTFGSVAEAEAAIRGVNRAHRSVHGVAPDGRPYDANDPELKRFIHLAMVDSFLVAHRRYGATRLSPKQRDQYVAEQAFVGERLGVPDCPQTADDLRTYFHDLRSAGELVASPVARETVRWLLRVKLGAATRAPYLLLATAAANSLPAWVRLQLRLPVLPLTDRLAVRPAAGALVKVVGWAMTAPPASGRESGPG